MEHLNEIYHPAVGFAYCMAVITLSFLFLHPVFLAAGIFCAAAVGAGHLKSLLRTLFFSLPVAALVAVFNPLTNHHGATTLFILGSSRFTTEALLYGVCSGGMLLLIFLWFSVYNRFVTPERFLFLFSKAVPAASLLVTMTQRMIPLFGRRFKSIYAAQKALGCDLSSGGIRTRFQNGLRLTSILMTWSLEDGLDTADSMKARGYGAARRTAYSLYRFGFADAVALAGIFLLFSLSLAGYLLSPPFRFFPVIRMPSFSRTAVFSLACYLILGLSPLIAAAFGSLKRFCFTLSR